MKYKNKMKMAVSKLSSLNQRGKCIALQALWEVYGNCQYGEP